MPAIHSFMRVDPFSFLICSIFLIFSLQGQTNGGTYSFDSYVPTTDRAFDAKVNSLRNQVSSFEEKLRESRLRWNHLFHSQYETSPENDKLSFKPSETKTIDSNFERAEKESTYSVRDNSNGSLATTSLNNRYYFGFSLGAFLPQEATILALDPRSPPLDMEFETGFTASAEIGRRFEQWSFSLNYMIAQSELSKESWSSWADKAIVGSGSGELFKHGILFEVSYTLALSPWMDIGFDGGIGYSFSAIEELPADAGVPELSANRMGYGLGFSSNIMLSDRASLSLAWKYIGTIGKSSPYEPINAYLVEIGTKLYF